MSITHGSDIDQARIMHRPHSGHKVMVKTGNSSSPESLRRFKLALNESVETQTPTRNFSPVLQKSTALADIDLREYPLAAKPIPLELLEFTLNLPDFDQPGVVNNPVYLQSASQTPQTCIQLKSTCPVARLDCRSPRWTFPDIPSPSRARIPSLLHRKAHLTCSNFDVFPTNEASELKFGNDNVQSSRHPLLHLSSPSEVKGLHLSHMLPAKLSQDDGIDTIDHRSCTDERMFDVSSALRQVQKSQTCGEMQCRSSGQNHAPSTLSLKSSAVERVSNFLSTSCDSANTTVRGLRNSFKNNVATPPITDTDVEPFAEAENSNLEVESLVERGSAHTMGTAAAQDASLPSPRLSPTLAVSRTPFTNRDNDNFSTGSRLSATETGSAHAEYHTGIRLHFPGRTSQFLHAAETGEAHAIGASENFRGVPNTQALLYAFDAMKTEMKAFMIYQFLQRCPRSTLRIVANAVNPALKCDFLRQLPLELSYHILSYLGCRELCRAAQVSRRWRSIVDRNETGWKELFDRDGLKLPPQELRKAIQQGWGWQDPEGPEGCERDLSKQAQLRCSETELTTNFQGSRVSTFQESASQDRGGVSELELIKSPRNPSAPKLRASKRKRAFNTHTASERSKRRAAAQELTSPAAPIALLAVGEQACDGPLSAASAAAIAVPDPQLGLPGLRHLHLFKSLYRRHHMIRKNWTSGRVPPSHVAFAAHPRHVITSLQFDDDKIITGSDDTLIHIYDTQTGKLRQKLEGHEGGVWALQYVDNILVSGSTDRSVRVWDIERGLCQQVFYGHTSTVRCLQILMPSKPPLVGAAHAASQPDKPLIITGSRDSQLRVWRLPEAGSSRYIQTHALAQESDCPYFIRVLAGHSHSVRAISAHGDTLVSGSYDTTVRVWRISTGEPLHVLRGHSQKVYSVVLDHARNRCISGSMDSLVKVWDLLTGACIHTLEGHTLLVGLLDLRDERLVSAAADSTLRIWDPESGRCRSTLIGHTGAITCFQHDGRKVISGSEKTVKMWDVKTGECLQDLLTDLSSMWQVKFDGRRCVAAVQRDQLTYIEVLDFGAIRDGQPRRNLGHRILLNEHELRAIINDGVR